MRCPKCGAQATATFSHPHGDFMLERQYLCSPGLHYFSTYEVLATTHPISRKARDVSIAEDKRTADEIAKTWGLAPNYIYGLRRGVLEKRAKRSAGAHPGQRPKDGA